MQMSATHPTAGMQALFCWSTIFTKTPKGREEIAQRRAGLNARQRSVLIMLDGIKRLDKLMSPIPKEELGTIVDFLAKQDLIEATSANQSADTVTAKVVTPAIIENPPAAAKPTAKREQFLTDEKKLREVKDFMTTTAHTYLGLLSADLIHRIERAKDAPQLMAILGQWYIALRDSKNGKRFASGYMEQILTTLRGEQPTKIAE